MRLSSPARCCRLVQDNPVERRAGHGGAIRDPEILQDKKGYAEWRRAPFGKDPSAITIVTEAAERPGFGRSQPAVAILRTVHMVLHWSRLSFIRLVNADRQFGRSNSSPHCNCTLRLVDEEPDIDRLQRCAVFLAASGMKIAAARIHHAQIERNVNWRWCGRVPRIRVSRECTVNLYAQ